ncbi:hypothetical protein [Rhizobium phaseoli]|uniref:hypothetical protein n=1 Tax=Rhizobium phaseoli TaxID=396 RepID=UPI0011127C6A|nr:hypothetical protein [Rhizobium phaseoli]
MTDMASPWPDKVAPIHRWGLKTKSRWSGCACTRCAKYPDQRLCWGRPPLDADFMVFWERLAGPYTALIAIDLCDSIPASCMPVWCFCFKLLNLNGIYKSGHLLVFAAAKNRANLLCVAVMAGVEFCWRFVQAGRDQVSSLWEAKGRALLTAKLAT